MVMNKQDNARLARQMCEKGLWQEVVNFAQQWRHANPGDPKALYYLGLGFSGTGHYARAEAAYRQALAMDPSDVNAWNNLAGLLYEKLQRHAEGIWCVEQALKIDPRHKVGWSNLATMVGRLGHHNKAMDCANRALALDPKLVEAHLHRANAALALGKMEIVKETCNALAAFRPEDFRRAR